jgi:hypothetical protein
MKIVAFAVSRVDLKKMFDFAIVPCIKMAEMV